MKKSIIALAVSSLALSATAAELKTSKGGVNIHESETTVATFGGYLDMNATYSALEDSLSSDSVSLENNSSRINLAVAHKLNEQTVIHAAGEWGTNFGHEGAALNTRLLYIGIEHDKLGKIFAGTQWSPYYDVAGVTDMPIAFGNDFLYEQHGVTGTARADQMISWRKALGPLNIAFAWQEGSGESSGAYTEISEYNDGLNGAGGDDHIVIEDINYELNTGHRYQATVDFTMKNSLMLGFAYNNGDIYSTENIQGIDINIDTPAIEDIYNSNTSTTGNLEIYAFSAKFGSYGKGLYAAAVYQIANYSLEDVQVDSYEILVSKSIMNDKLNIAFNYENSTSQYNDPINAGTVTTTDTMSINFEYDLDGKAHLYAAYQYDFTDTADHQTKLGMRYYIK